MVDIKDVVSRVAGILIHQKVSPPRDCWMDEREKPLSHERRTWLTTAGKMQRVKLSLLDEPAPCDLCRCYVQRL